MRRSKHELYPNVFTIVKVNKTYYSDHHLLEVNVRQKNTTQTLFIW